MCKAPHLKSITTFSVFALTLLAYAHAYAQDAYGEHYTGSFLALGAYGGPTLTTTTDGQPGWSSGFGVWSQASSPLQLLDAHLGYQHSQASVTLSDQQELALTQDSISFALGLHPFFLAHLESDTLGYILGSVYLLAGADLERVQASFSNEEVVQWDPSIILGSGFDVPLDDVDNGGALWMGLQYRYNIVALDRPTLRDLNLHQHMIFVPFSYRHNGLIVPVPADVWP